jgi:hypothetical protein
MILGSVGDSGSINTQCGTDLEGNPNTDGEQFGPENARPKISTKLSNRVTEELPDGEVPTVAENNQARAFFESHRAKARKWWEDRTGQQWPSGTSHDEHPRAIKNGGDPLYIEPGFGGSAQPHMDSDFKFWGGLRGNPKKIP